jgi:hypothetical protein
LDTLEKAAKVNGIPPKDKKEIEDMIKSLRNGTGNVEGYKKNLERIKERTKVAEKTLLEGQIGFINTCICNPNKSELDDLNFETVDISPGTSVESYHANSISIIDLQKDNIPNITGEFEFQSSPSSVLGGSIKKRNKNMKITKSMKNMKNIKKIKGGNTKTFLHNTNKLTISWDKDPTYDKDIPKLVTQTEPEYYSKCIVSTDTVFTVMSVDGVNSIDLNLTPSEITFYNSTNKDLLHLRETILQKYKTYNELLIQSLSIKINEFYGSASSKTLIDEKSFNLNEIITEKPYKKNLYSDFFKIDRILYKLNEDTKKIITDYNLDPLSLKNSFEFITNSNRSLNLFMNKVIEVDEESSLKLGGTARDKSVLRPQAKQDHYYNLLFAHEIDDEANVKKNRDFSKNVSSNKQNKFYNNKLINNCNLFSSTDYLQNVSIESNTEELKQSLNQFTKRSNVLFKDNSSINNLFKATAIVNGQIVYNSMKRLIELKIQQKGIEKINIEDNIAKAEFMNFYNTLNDTDEFQKLFKQACGDGLGPTRSFDDNYEHNFNYMNNKNEPNVFKIKHKYLKKFCRSYSWNSEHEEIMDKEYYEYVEPNIEEMGSSLSDYFLFFQSRQIYDFINTPYFSSKIESETILKFENIGMNKKENCWMNLFRRFYQRPFWLSSSDLYGTKTDNINGSMIEICRNYDEKAEDAAKESIDREYNKQSIKCIILANYFFYINSLLNDDFTTIKGVDEKVLEDTKVSSKADDKCIDILNKDTIYQNYYENPVDDDVLLKLKEIMNSANLNYLHKKHNYEIKASIYSANIMTTTSVFNELKEIRNSLSSSNNVTCQPVYEFADIVKDYVVDPFIKPFMKNVFLDTKPLYYIGPSLLCEIRKLELNYRTWFNTGFQSLNTLYTEFENKLKSYTRPDSEKKEYEIAKSRFDEAKKIYDREFDKKKNIIQDKIKNGEFKVLTKLPDETAGFDQINIFYNNFTSSIHLIVDELKIHIEQSKKINEYLKKTIFYEIRHCIKMKQGGYNDDKIKFSQKQNDRFINLYVRNSTYIYILSSIRIQLSRISYNTLYTELNTILERVIPLFKDIIDNSFFEDMSIEAYRIYRNYLHFNYKLSNLMD